MRALCFCLALVTAQAQQTVVVHVNLFDGTKLLRNQTVVVSDGVIKEAGPSKAGHPEGAFDGKGKTLLPALIDSASVQSEDWVQLVYDDGFAWGKRNPPVRLEALHDEIERVHKERKQALVEVGSLRESMEALKADADGLLRIFAGAQSDPLFVKHAVKRKVFIIPMLTALERAATKSGKPRMEGALDALKDLHAAHVPLLAGGPDLVQELELLVRDVGLTPLEALQAATSVPARVFGIHPKGYVVVDGDPTVSISVLRTAKSVK